ncbi:SDR family oxidoreductase [Burkholderia sp. WSM2232]|uniref:SDR family oxidoreductase n=1 Tax=Burkholderia sp. WSM2232 TaxID=944436 RepID=UPI0004138473
MSKASKVALVTGASGGIGKAVALRLAADGFPVAGHGQPNDIAGTVAFLVGDDGEWINGQIVYVNGGFA